MTHPNNRTIGSHLASRRSVLIGGVAGASALALIGPAPLAARPREIHSVHRHAGRAIKTKDGTEIFYKDWGRGPTVIFSHGWPLNADAWDDQMFFMASHGFRCIAYDRRGHGRSGQPWSGNDYDTFASDLADLIDSLRLEQVTLVGHSAGGGDIARYIGRFGTGRVAKAVLVSAIPPLMLKTSANPGGVPIEVFDNIRSAVVTDRAQFYRDLGEGPFYGANRPGSKVSQGARDAFWLSCMQVGLRASYEGIKAFSETDFTSDLKRFDVPTLIVHGEDDQNVPIATSALLSSKMIGKASLKIYPGAPHGLTLTHKDQFNGDLLGFMKDMS
ncbi:alpha/beta fold hydrolase [Bradyrhizobium sp. HKCCYLRH2015]|uniref:alpha/beta fold hydrolase n=1 Tax=Bradyrhizobium sp. HKCCYLRH2015 TaxID=3420742 RepID=UPI003EBB67CF